MKWHLPSNQYSTNHSHFIALAMAPSNKSAKAANKRIPVTAAKFPR